MPYCPDCGTELEPTASFCPECGTEVDRIYDESSKSTQVNTELEQSTSSQSGTTTHSDEELIKQYSPIAWIGAIVSGISIIARGVNNPSAIFPLTVLAGLAVPGYFGYNTIQDEPVNQTTVEVWTTILTGVFGIAAVEFAGDRGARILWKIIIAVVILWIIVLLV